MLVYYFVPFIVSNRYLLFRDSNGHNSVTVQNRTHVYMNFYDHKDLGNHLLQLCPKVVKHPVYMCVCVCVCVCVKKLLRVIISSFFTQNLTGQYLRHGCLYDKQLSQNLLMYFGSLVVYTWSEPSFYNTILNAHRSRRQSFDHSRECFLFSCRSPIFISNQINIFSRSIFLILQRVYKGLQNNYS